MFLTFLCSAQNDICPLKVGEKIPTINLQNIESETFNLNEQCQKPTVLIFFRGGWCGHCSRHLSAIQEAKEDIEKLGYQIIAITPDAPSKLSKSISKADLEYRLLSDAKTEAIDAFGLSFKVEGKMANRVNEWNGSEINKLTVPAVYIVNEGEVLFNYVNPNYSKRLKAETLISLLKTL